MSNDSRNKKGKARFGRKVPQDGTLEACENERQPAAFSIDRTFSASSEFYDEEEEVDNDDNEETAIKLDACNKTTTTAFPISSVQRYICEEFEDAEELSIGLPSDLPSGLVDIEGNIIGDVQIHLGQESQAELQFDFVQNDELLKKHKTARIDPDHNSHSNEDKNHPFSNDSPITADGESSSNDQNKEKAFRQKSILRQGDHNGRGSGNGSFVISDGKIGSMNSSFNSSHFYNNFYSRAAQRSDFNKYTRGPYAPLDRCNSTSASSANSSKISQHYYPEGGWGYIILATAMFSHALLCGFLLSAGVFSTKVLEKFGQELRMETVWLTSLSLGCSLMLSPISVSICKRKSTRLTAVFGGLVAALGCLFTSFATQFHQLFVSYVMFMGVGVGLSRDASNLMISQYFKKKMNIVQIFLVSASGLGLLVMSSVLESVLSAIGWRLGLQAVTSTFALVFILGSCYRSASLYHPQRRAILHLKNQKRKIKEKEKKNDRPPFLDMSCLTSRSLQIMLVSCLFTAWGLYSPLFHLALECQDEFIEGMDRALFYVYIGCGWIVGVFLFGFLSWQKNEDCRISKMYLCQVASLVSGMSIIALTTITDGKGLVTFSWVYGMAIGGYHYTLKIMTFEKVKARVFSRAWSFIQGVQGIALVFGVPVTGYINTFGGWRKGYFLSAGAVFLGVFIMFLSSIGSRRFRRNKSSRSSMKTETTESMQSPGLRRISFTFPEDQVSPQRLSSKGEQCSCADRSPVSVESPSQNQEDEHLVVPNNNKELTRISEEGMLDTTTTNQ